MFPEFGKEFGQYLVMMNLKTMEFGKPWDEESFKNPQLEDRDVSPITECTTKTKMFIYTESERLTMHGMFPIGQ